jgi:CheY-like chemotaxis protein/HPt (histidine-containing phosphotransfer) domain-containing protein
LGVGSTFWFDLPLLRAPAHTEDAVEKPTVGILLADADTARSLIPLLRAACGRIDQVSEATSLVHRLVALRGEGYSVTAIFAAGDVERARVAFELVGRESEAAANPVAMIYLAAAAVSVDGAHLAGIDGAIAVATEEVSPRVLRNAIHAATTRDSSTGAQVIALADVLRQKRQALRILVAEDNATNQAIICRLLESAGHSVLIAQDGEEALDAFSANAPELAILDFNMPLRTGTEVATAIRTMEAAGVRMPIILLSASVTPESRERALTCGADEFVGKPFDAGTLLQTIDRLARRASRGNQQPAARRDKLGSVTELEQPVLDQARLAAVEEIAPDEQFLATLLRGFQSDVEKLLAQLDRAVSSSKLVDAVDAAHGIRGAALGIGARRLAVRAESVEAAASSGDVARVSALAAGLRPLFDVTKQQLSSYAIRKHRVSL